MFIVHPTFDELDEVIIFISLNVELSFGYN